MFFEISFRVRQESGHVLLCELVDLGENHLKWYAARGEVADEFFVVGLESVTRLDEETGPLQSPSRGEVLQDERSPFVSGPVAVPRRVDETNVSTEGESIQGSRVARCRGRPDQFMTLPAQEDV